MVVLQALNSWKSAGFSQKSCIYKKKLGCPKKLAFQQKLGFQKNAGYKTKKGFTEKLRFKYKKCWVFKGKKDWKYAAKWHQINSWGFACPLWATVTYTVRNVWTSVCHPYVNGKKRSDFLLICNYIFVNVLRLMIYSSHSLSKNSSF